MLSFKNINNNFMLKIIGLIIIYGIIIEVIQEKCTQNREADILDVVANSLGVFLAYFGFSLIRRKILKK